MIELVSAQLVAGDDARLAAAPRPARTSSAWGDLARDLQIAESALRDTFRLAQHRLREDARRCGPASTLRHATCLADALLEDTLDFARSRRSQGKVLLTCQAVALRVANLYLALLGLEQALEDVAADGLAPSPARCRHAGELLQAALRNAAQVLAGSGFVDNPGFAELHQGALDTVRDLAAGAAG